MMAGVLLPTPKYRRFPLQQFLASKPNVARCEYCGRVFIPKTRKKTKYCDRIVRDGKTCKQIAPHLNRKERASADRVISEFNRVNDMLLHRVERPEYDKKESPIDLPREEYYAWLDKAVCARDSYLAGQLPEEEAIQIIHIPTIQELRENQNYFKHCKIALTAHQTAYNRISFLSGPSIGTTCPKLFKTESAIQLSREPEHRFPTHFTYN